MEKVVETIIRVNSMELRFQQNAVLWMNTYIKAHDKFQDEFPCWKVKDGIHGGIHAVEE